MAGKKKVENSGKINSEEIKQNTSSVQGANATGDVSSSNPVASQVDDASNTEVRISKIRKEDGTVVIKKTIVKKVVKAKPADGAEAVEDNSREQQEEVKVQKDEKDTTAQNSTDAVKVPDDKDGAGLEEVTKEDSKSEDKSDEISSEKSAEKTANDDSKTDEKSEKKREKTSKDKKSSDKKDKSEKKSKKEDKKEQVADKAEEDASAIEKQKKQLEKQLKKQEAKDQKKALKEKLKSLKETPFVNVEVGEGEGLNDAQIEERELRGLTNRVDNSISKSYLKIFTTNIFTLFNLLNIFLACLIIIFNGQIKNMLFAGIAMINLVIGIIQEIRSKKALDKLSLVSAPSIEAVRNGQIVEISTDEIVIDDIIILKQGSQIPTDCIVVGGECEANESLLTGEQDDIHKGLGDKLMSGSFVQSGKCRARVIAVGEDTYASKLMSEAKKFKKSKSELMRSINWIIRIATIIIFPLGILMFVTNMKHATSTSGAVTSTVSSIIGMIPEGLVMLTSVALALGIIRLAKKRTLVQDLYSIEALARVDVLCLDKTGTITEGSMQVESVHVYSSKFGSPDDIMANMVKALGTNNATFEACAEYFSSNETYKVSKLMPFSSARKWSGVTFNEQGTFIVGAPEFVLKDRYSLVERNVNEYAMEGYRVLVLISTPEQLQDGNMDTSKMELVALIVLSDKIRSTAAATFEYFEQQGVQLKVISGDNPLTVSKVAERAGMKNAEKYVDASVDLDTPDKIFEAAEKYTVFGRVSPSQKKELVAALKAHGHTVGMTGDGVNDVMALKEADCSIAMASGSDASRNVAQLVLLDSDFSSLPSVVSEGRRVINNIERASSLFLVKTTFSAVLSLLLIIFQFSTYPFEPIQLTLINALFVGVPSFILALEPNDRRVKGNFLSKVFKRALPAGLTVAFAIILICGMYNDIGFDVSPQISTMSVYITASVSFIVLVQVCMPYTKDKIFMLALLLVAFIFVVSNNFLSEKFSLVSLNSEMILKLVIIIVCIIPIMAFMRVEIEAFKALFKETGGFIKREKDRAKNFFNRFDNKK
ncbi:MAG: HAD-IC family P-type ATPase [Clostridia bacterium]|nr:HAD-IC family P-type ATPase [Clostridia bacterium]